ncbi:hypothetical protein CK203_007273 [Vitis vinifera]|uniref:Malectin-like domain-containing protein n=1 Tax=Vitis vinifera TaxID=29760 RepID=A0A438G1G7_VITVI|nr:hypothetical protein CK203_007273 [Vitis vinifera]
MEKSILVMVLVLAVLPYQLQSYYTPYNRLSIDCGATNTWKIHSQTTGGEGTKNCYNLPLEVQEKYLIRAGFYYGNYDNLSKPPTFNLELMATYGLLSLLLLAPTPSIMKLMNNDTALYLERRTNYGANQTFPERFDTLAEYYNRFWKPEQLPNYQNPFNGIDSDFSSMAENSPPYKVLNSAIRAQMFRTPSSCLSIFMRRLHSQPTLLRPYEECVVVSVYPVNVTGTANVTISPAQGTTLPPTLNAMEVFTTIEVSTSKSDPRLSFCAFFYVLVCLSGVVVWFG